MSTKTPIRIAVDIGGTFTDLQIYDSRGGQAVAYKTPTTPSDPSIGFMTGVREASEKFGFALSDVGLVMHGTTIATNATLENKLAKGALVTTRGFTDVLEIGRHVRRDIYTLKAETRRVLVPRHRRHGITERMRADGSVETPLAVFEIEALAETLRQDSVEAVAICLLNAYANPAHERALKAHLEKLLPDVSIALSTDVVAEMMEYERSATVALNALLTPVIARYLDRLSERMKEADFAPPLYLIQSNGGAATPAQAAAQPVRLLLSGPSGGAMATARVSQRLSLPNVVGVDMGGTSLDVCVVADGECAVVNEGEIDGLPVRVPMIEIRTIGAGGGSIADVDVSGRLRVGPKSAGASPGPACYGKGGTSPTVTDANVALRRIDPDYFLGGAMSLDGDAAAAALSAHVAGPLKLAIEPAAEGVLAVANANMAAAIKLSLFEKGFDPRDFALVAFGGAGGLHACDLARELAVETVVFPRNPGTFSADGILYTDIVHDLARSRITPATPAYLPVLGELAQALLDEGDALLKDDGVGRDARQCQLSVDMRYRSQAFALTISCDSHFDESWLSHISTDFHALHQQRFAHNDVGAALEIVTLRVQATGILPKPVEADVTPHSDVAEKGARRVWFDGGWTSAQIHERDALSVESKITGPAIIEETYSTLLLPSGWSMSVTPSGDLLATRDGKEHG